MVPPRLLGHWAFFGRPERPRYTPDKDPNPGQRVAVSGDSEPAAFLDWQSVPLNPQGFVNFGPLFGHAEYISAYALLRVYSPEKQRVAILLGSDDSVQLSLNGKQIHEKLISRKAIPEEDAIPAMLEPGWNIFLARVGKRDGRPRSLLAALMFARRSKTSLGQPYPAGSIKIKCTPQCRQIPLPTPHFGGFDNGRTSARCARRWRSGRFRERPSRRLC